MDKIKVGSLQNFSSIILGCCELMSYEGQFKKSARIPLIIATKALPGQKTRQKTFQ